ncbi:MAG: hypothetical protein WA110_06715 [Anaerolineaceae bacterium]
MARKRYADDYETVVTTDEKGREKKTAVYRGDYFELSLEEEGIVKFKRNCLQLLAVIVLLHVGGGFVGNRGMYQFYVALPYVFSFFPLTYLAEGILRLPKEKRKFRREEIGLSFDRMKTASTVLLIFLGVGVLGEIAFLLFSADGNEFVLEYRYLALEALAAAAVYFIIRLRKRIHVQTCSDQQPGQDASIPFESLTH